MKSKHCFRKKDNFKDKKRIKRIIFLETREVTKIQTIPKLSSYSHFQIYPSDYNGFGVYTKSAYFTGFCVYSFNIVGRKR